MVRDDDAIHAMFNGILNVLFGGDCSRNMIRLVCGIVFMIKVDVFLHSETDLLSPRARGLSGFEPKELIPPRFPRHLKFVHEKAASINCTRVLHDTY